MDRTAQALEMAKCLDALPCSWGCVATFSRTIDGRNYLFNLFSRDTSVEIVAAFSLDFPESRRLYYESMAEDFTARTEIGRFYIAGNDLRLSVSTLRRGEDDVVPAEGIDYLLKQCFSLIAQFAPEVFSEDEDDDADDSFRSPGEPRRSSYRTMLNRLCSMIGIEAIDDEPDKGSRTHDKN